MTAYANGAMTLAVPAELVEAIVEQAVELVVERLAAAQPEPWMTVDQAAEYLACPRSRVYALTSTNRIPHVKDGSRVLLRASALDTWLGQGGGIRP